MTRAERDKAVREWEQFKKEIARQTQVQHHEDASDRRKRFQRMDKHPELVVQHYFPHYHTAPMARFQKREMKEARKRRKFRRLLRWGRAHAKSVYANIIIPFDLWWQNELYVMALIGKNAQDAGRLLGDIQAEFEANERIIADFGKQKILGDWQEGEFMTQRNNAAFKALGLKQSPRGLRFGPRRPDYVSIDDADSKELVQSPEQVRKAFEWVTEDLEGVFDENINVKGGLPERVYVCNNLFSKNSINYLLEQEANYEVHQVNALDSKGRPNWPEKYNAAYFEEKKQQNWLAFERNYMNNPIEPGRVFKAEWIDNNWVNPGPLRELSPLVAYYDPSIEANSTSDYKAIVILGRRNQDFVVVDCFVRQSTWDEALHWWYEWYQTLPKDVTMHCWMEQQFVSTWIHEEFKKKNEAFGFPFPLRIDAVRTKSSKYFRIESMVPWFAHGHFKFNKQRQHSQDFENLVNQIKAFEQKSQTPDDGPDALQGAADKALRLPPQGATISGICTGSSRKVKGA